MIQSNELRVGNLVYLNDSDLIENQDVYEGVAIHEIEGEDIEMCQMFNDDFNLFYKNIPINEKWLLKFGFEKDGLEYTKPLSVVTDLHLSYGGDGYGYVSSVRQWDENSFEEDHQVFIEDTEYIHQLQNLYFALAGEELSLDVS